jgi:hypothetical protein
MIRGFVEWLGNTAIAIGLAWLLTRPLFWLLEMAHL